eukprot:13515461-Heterocapsa_arctica.AAC.1
MEALVFMSEAHRARGVRRPQPFHPADPGPRFFHALSSRTASPPARSCLPQALLVERRREERLPARET